MHHIPSKSVMRGWGSIYSMPAIAVKKDDHARTDSFRAKAYKKHHSFIIDDQEETSYQDEAAQRLLKDQIFDLVKIELLNIRDQCGHKYDGAIKKYLDALEDYLQTHYPPTDSE